LNTLLKNNNEILLTSKPNLPTVIKITEWLKQYYPNKIDKIQFRFTITSSISDQDLTEYWETDAPSIMERIMCLKYAEKEGFKTSVSCEPYLTSSLSNLELLYISVEPYLTESFWIGTMNDRWVLSADYNSVKHLYSRNALEKIIERFKNQKYIRFKDAISNEMNIDLYGNKLRENLNEN